MKGKTIMKKKEQVKISKQEDMKEIFEDYEPDGRDLAEHIASQQQWLDENPNITMEDIAEYYAEMQSEIERGK